MFKNIQGLRFLAALLVFMNHSYYIISKTKVFDYGGRGVELFFILSGFLMAFHYGKKPIDSSWKASIKYAYQKAKKFYALHLATFAVMAAFFLYKYIVAGTGYKGGSEACIRDVVLNLTLLKSWYLPARFSFNGVTWFLSSLLFIYLLLPKTVSFFRKKSRGDIGVAFCVILLLKLVLDTCFGQRWFSPYPGFSAYTNPMYRYLDFLLGYLGFGLLHNEETKSTALVNGIQGTMLILYFGCCYFFNKLWSPVPFILAGLLLIYAFSLSGGFFDTLFGNKIITHLGDISLEFFMVHVVVIKILRGNVQKFFHNEIFTFVMLLLLSLLVAEIVYRRKWIWGFLTRKNNKEIQ